MRDSNQSETVQHLSMLPQPLVTGGWVFVCVIASLLNLLRHLQDLIKRASLFPPSLPLNTAISFSSSL